MPVLVGPTVADLWGCIPPDRGKIGFICLLQERRGRILANREGLGVGLREELLRRSF